MTDNLKLEFYRTLFNISEYFLENVTKNVESYGMTVNDFRILELLHSDERIYTVQKICEELHIPNGSITYVVNRLVKQGYVQKTPSPNDGRASQVELTKTGKKMIQDILPEHVQYITSKLGEISEEDIYKLIELLVKVGIYRKD